MINDWNTVIRFLAQQETCRNTYDLAILAGNSLPYLADELFKLYQSNTTKAIMIAGGRGHATTFLKENLKKEGIKVDETSEAEMCQVYLQYKYKIDEHELLVESESTNSGENARYAYKKIQEVGIKPASILLLQDPILQRRTKATFKKQWQDPVSFSNYVPKIPIIKRMTEKLYFEDETLTNLWTKDYFLSLVLGEIPRLRNDKYGYGPNGQNYIEAVAIPKEIEEAYQRLIKMYPSWEKR